MLLAITTNVQAITSNDVTYDNNGTTENLTKSLDTLYNELKKYKTGGSVEANQMLAGVSGYSKGELVTGTIPSKGATTYTPGTTNQTITSGQYLSGTQTIAGDANLKAENIKSGVNLFGVNGTYTSDANAVAGQILSGYTAYVNGNKITGNMPNYMAQTLEAKNISQDATYTYLNIPLEGYYNESSQVKVLNNSIGVQNPRIIEQFNKGTFNATFGTNSIFNYQVPQTGLYLVIAGVRFSADNKYTDGAAHVVNAYISNNATTTPTEPWNSSNGTPVIGGEAQHLQTSFVLEAAQGSYINFSIYCSQASKIEGGRMQVILLK